MKNLALCVIAIPLALSSGACSSIPKPLEDPKVDVREVVVSYDPQANLVVGNFDLDVTNPNGVSVPLRRIEYQIEIGGQTAVGIVDAPHTIPAKGTAPVHALVAAAPQSVAFAAAGYALGARTYKLTGHAEFKTSLGAIKVPFRQEGQL